MLSWPRPRSLQLRLSLLFVVLLVAVSGVYLLLISRNADDYLAENMQRRNLDLAASIANVLSIDSATNEIAPTAIAETFHAAMVINPNIKLYLIGLDGHLLAASAQPNEIQTRTVAMAPVHDLLAGRQPLPLYGTDPRHPARPRPFSVAPLHNRGGGVHCYLYITLDGPAAASSEPAALRQNHLLGVLLRTLLVAGAGVLVVGLLLISLLTRDVQRLVAVVRRLQAGDYSARARGIGANDELSELATAFNAMSVRTEQALDELRTTDALRRELVANISHDLRTPLASIEGYTETILLRQHLLAPAEQQQYLETILKNTHSLKRLISELFELSKLEAHQTVPQPEPFSLPELVHDVVQQLKPSAQTQAVTLRVDPTPAALPFAYADVGLLERVLQNLLDNALRYTPAGGAVSVQVTPTAGRLALQVRDTGPGIAAPDLPRLFDRFYHSDQVRRKSRGGSGLGLAIARKIVELHGGELTVSSTQGQGACFTFSVPVYEP
ncbi:two-component sensor histidine kinase [Hymenobacter amundsenii]|uniref:histidine kinase n=1 Tax=Hymenobacter amundsenii TaxID=2006685 RepID=A0A246FI54_9BACT|nr:HAMP domain-containing sensor histidine kinase [Hymenobacter amundsenii]OWP62213.1 two-component sensor histidine kinase [Hymenobacter amundsenii]